MFFIYILIYFWYYLVSSIAVYRKDRGRAMLKVNNQENLIMFVFLVILFVLGVCVVINKKMVDIIYLHVMFIYFIKFLIIRFKKN